MRLCMYVETFEILFKFMLAGFEQQFNPALTITFPNLTGTFPVKRKCRNVMANYITTIRQSE